MGKLSNKITFGEKKSLNSYPCWNVWLWHGYWVLWSPIGIFSPAFIFSSFSSFAGTWHSACLAPSWKGREWFYVDVCVLGTNLKKVWIQVKEKEIENYCRTELMWKGRRILSRVKTEAILKNPFWVFQYKAAESQHLTYDSLNPRRWHLVPKSLVGLNFLVNMSPSLSIFSSSYWVHLCLLAAHCLQGKRWMDLSPRET